MGEHAAGRDFETLVAVKAKPGELEALLHMSSDEVRRVQPVVELLSGVAGNSRMLSRLAEIAMMLGTCGRRLMLDVSQLHPSSSLWRQPHGPFGYMARVLEEHLGLHASEVPAFVPVVCLNGTERHMARVALVLEELGRGVALRVPHASTSAPDLPGRLERCLRRLRVDPADVDLLLDVGFLARPPLEPDTKSVAATLTRLPWQRFRSVTLLSGSVPESRGAFDRDRSRPEHALWHQLLTRAPALRYGDYGVVHPRARDGPGARGWTPRHPYLHYTRCQRSHYFTRRLPPEGVAAEENRELKRRYFGELAQRVTELYPDASRSWGDRVLDDYARHGGTADASRWVAIGTSHHIAHLAAGGDLVREESPVEE
ncbi:beta family protein [Haloactinomyces albus]|uniref:T4 beta protein n=1 Tax=Haloactinomyces albus TaxID=1352928 RepID=A0AAE3Z948_9ACTN|nr:hypothetical protein [Haloactinomyces albus]MDR7300606.1 hypothetical protein [Haloactinomyces albus]